MDTLKIKDQTSVTWRTLLLVAADIIRKCGHTRDCPEPRPDSPACPIIALTRAQMRLGCASDIYSEALSRMEDAIGGGCIVIWNRTQDAASVIAMFENAAFTATDRNGN